MQFTIVDGGVLLVTVLSGLLAYARGLTREVFAIGGWIAAAVAAFYLTPLVEPLMREAPVVGDFLASSCVISTVAAFTLVVGAALLVLSVFTPLFAGLVQDSVLGGLDRALGFVFGVARGVVLVAVAYVIYTAINPESVWPPLEQAASRAVFEETATVLRANLPTALPDWFGARIDALMAPCGGAAPTPPAAAPGTTQS